MRDELPEEIQSLIGQCEVGVNRFTNDQMSAALYFAEVQSRIVARLPRTADGVPVVCDGMVVFCPKGHEHKLTTSVHRVYCCKGECWSDGCQGDSGSGTGYPFNQCRAAPPAPSQDTPPKPSPPIPHSRSQERRFAEQRGEAEG